MVAASPAARSRIRVPGMPVMCGKSPARRHETRARFRLAIGSARLLGYHRGELIGTRAEVIPGSGPANGSRPRASATRSGRPKGVPDPRVCAQAKFGARRLLECRCPCPAADLSLMPAGKSYAVRGPLGVVPVKALAIARTPAGTGSPHLSAVSTSKRAASAWARLIEMVFGVAMISLAPPSLGRSGSRPPHCRTSGRG
jgi:hypothetical protein